MPMQIIIYYGENELLLLKLELPLSSNLNGIKLGNGIQLVRGNVLMQYKEVNLKIEAGFSDAERQLRRFVGEC